MLGWQVEDSQGSTIRHSDGDPGTDGNALETSIIVGQCRTRFHGLRQWPNLAARYSFDPDRMVQSGFAILIPLELQPRCIFGMVRVEGFTCIQGNGVARVNAQRHVIGPFLAIYYWNGWMNRFAEIRGDCPTHASSKIVLIVTAPPAYGCLLVGPDSAVDVNEGVHDVGIVSTSNIDGSVAASPAAKVGVFGAAQAVLYEEEEGRRVAFHDVHGLWIDGTERSEPYILLEPFT